MKPKDEHEVDDLFEEFDEKLKVHEQDDRQEQVLDES